MKITFRRQETSYSCVPACLRMVLSGFGVEISEGQLREDCDTTFLGTDAFCAVLAARRLGFENSDKQKLNYEELGACVAAGLFPIVFVSAKPIDALPDFHAVVVIAVTDDHVQIARPCSGRAAASPLGLYQRVGDGTQFDDPNSALNNIHPKYSLDASART